MIAERVEFYFVEMRGEEFLSVTISDLRLEALDYATLVAYELWKVAHGLA